MKKLSFNKTLIIIVVLLFAVEVITLGLMASYRSDTNKKLSDVTTRNDLLQGQIDSDGMQLPLSVLPGSDRLYLPELNITLPANDVTRYLRYNFLAGATRSQGDEVRLYSTLVIDHQMRIKSCLDMVRLKIEAAPNAYSPSQPHYATVKLSDGRTLQIYISKLAECNTVWQAVNPQQIADNFTHAQVYKQ
jgi:hypothetical protein